VIPRHSFTWIAVLMACFGVMIGGDGLISANEPADRYVETVARQYGGEISFEMVLIPAGTFLMGSGEGEPGRAEHEGPQHLVRIDPFYLCTTETTIELFQAYYEEMATPKRGRVDAITQPTPVYGDVSMGYSGKHPAVAASWFNAVTFCRWLSKKTGKTYRLPTETEWEYAARAGSSRIYGFADGPEQLNDFAWYEDNSHFEPHRVAAKNPSAWGLYDMLGNVQEWVHDFYSPTAYVERAEESPAVNPQGPSNGKVHVARGGCWDSTLAELRCAARGFEEDWWRMSDPQLPKSRWWLPQMDHIGFRVARSADVGTDPAKPEFRSSGAEEYSFDTGLLSGNLRKNGASTGLSSVVHAPSGARLDGGAGILSYYRIFERNKRYGDAAWQWQSNSKVLDDGAVVVTWPAVQGRPFEMTGTYRWSDSRTLDVETTVSAEEDLEDFEVFVASYFDEAFESPYMYVVESGEQPQKRRLVPVKRELGEWQMFARDESVVDMIRDGRWRIEPHPVQWADTVRMAAPVCVRRSAAADTAVVLMSPTEDCFAISAPYEGESHYSLYLSLFGRDVKAGTSAGSRARFVVRSDISEDEIAALYRDYVKSVGTHGPASGKYPPAESKGTDTKLAGARVLIVTGIDYPGHLWKETTPVLKKALLADRRLSVDVVEEPEYLASEKLDQYDTIVLHFMNWERPDPSRKAQQNLQRFVESGKGLVLVHFACGAFQGWNEFENLAGRVWDPNKRPHDPYGGFTVNIVGKEHPITRGFSDFETVDELYTCLAGDTPVEVIASAISKVDNEVYPMTFVLNYGKGRVFHCVLGHDAQAIANRHVAELFRRACAWTTGLEPVEQKNVLFVAGKDSHDESSHRHTDGLRFFKKCLDTSPNVTGIKTTYIFEDELYKNPAILDDADTVVMYSDGWENHPIANRSVLEKTRELMSRSVGLVCIHFAIAPPKDSKTESLFLKWLGGMYEDGYSKNPMATIRGDFSSLDHPVSGGCTPFTVADEFYYRLRFADRADITPILTITQPEENPAEQVVAWAYQRPDGGRSFGISGGHFHKSWQIESLRKMVLNAIVWTAGGYVPADGLQSAK